MNKLVLIESLALSVLHIHLVVEQANPAGGDATADPVGRHWRRGTAVGEARRDAHQGERRLRVGHRERWLVDEWFDTKKKKILGTFFQ